MMNINDMNRNERKATARNRDEVIQAIVKAFENDEELFNSCIEDLDVYNGYLGDDRYYSMYDIDELYSCADPTDLLRLAFYGYDADSRIIDQYGKEFFGTFNPNREFFTYNGYGNFVSTDYKDYSSYLDSWTVEAMSENRNYIYNIEHNEELARLFDELEK